eukprot:scaffold7887_cov81-Skeletonema_dohrnii-CCMP3373.AAC.5
MTMSNWRLKDCLLCRVVVQPNQVAKILVQMAASEGSRGRSCVTVSQSHQIAIRHFSLRLQIQLHCFENEALLKASATTAADESQQSRAKGELSRYSC